MNLRTFIIFFLFATFFSSCHSPSYHFSGNSTAYGINFQEGKWLMNYIDAPISVKPEMTEIALKTFKPYLGNNLQHIGDVNGIMIPGEIPINPTPETLKNVKIGTGFDYFINIKSSILKDEVGSVQIGKMYRKKQNVVKVVLEVYDLNNAYTIYEQTVTGVLSAEKNNMDFALSKGSSKMIVAALKKIMKRIEKSQD